MIDLYTWSTPNGRKVSIALEELELPYTVHAVNISKDEQFDPEFLKHSPNNKIPAIFDQKTGQSLMESGAILICLAEQTGQLLPSAGEARSKVLEWLMWQMGGLGPICGQGHHFLKYNPGKVLTLSNASALKSSDFTECWTDSLPKMRTSPERSIPSRTSPRGRGFRVLSGIKRISTPFQM